MAARLRLPLESSPTEVLLGLRDRANLVALLGAGWDHGQALVAFDPIQELADHADPFEVLNGSATPPSATAQFTGGWIGYWGYPLLHRLESVTPGQGRLPTSPSHALAYFDRALRFVEDTWWAEGSCSAEELAGWAKDVMVHLAHPTRAGARPYAFSEFVPDRPPAEHRAAVARAIRHLQAGDIFQVNLCTVLRSSFEGDPLDVFCGAFDRLQPSFGAFVRHRRGAIASMSPELFLRRRGSHVTTAPIKGTAPRGSTPTSDSAARDRLLGSTKDNAENVMIVDLMRNDLARICTPGTVWASGVRAEPHAVWHLVADVTGRVPPSTTDADLLRATFPPGSVTGAPKVRALQLISELEVTDRGAYTGAIGVAAGGFGLELNVAIRTLEFDTSGAATIGVGGGIVIDSDPHAEWLECVAKAAPILRAVGAPITAAAVGAGPHPRTSASSVAKASSATPMGPGNPPAEGHRSGARDVAVRRTASTSRAPGPVVLVIDNYDSFVHNLADYADQAGATVRVVRNDALDVSELLAMRRRGEFSHLLVSPGPGAPVDAGISVEAVERLGPVTPVLGVCLGHQAIIEAYGGVVCGAPRVVHGRASAVRHTASGVWAGLPTPLTLGRYHSLAADPGALPRVLDVTAVAEDGVIMGVQHHQHPVHGIQGHPESVLSSHGRELIGNFLRVGPPVRTAGLTPVDQPQPRRR